MQVSSLNWNSEVRRLVKDMKSKASFSTNGLPRQTEKAKYLKQFPVSDVKKNDKNPKILSSGIKIYGSTKDKNIAETTILKLNNINEDYVKDANVFIKNDFIVKTDRGTITALYDNGNILIGESHDNIPKNVLHECTHH